MKYPGIKKCIIIVIAFFCFQQLGCRPVLGLIYGVNKNYTFKNSDAYLQFIKKKNKIPEDIILHSDSLGSLDLLQYFKTTGSNNGYLLGLYLDDTTRIKESADLEADENCPGRIIHDVDADSNIYHLKTQPDTLLKYKNLYYFVNGNKFHFTRDGKIKIIALYTTDFGRLYNSSFSLLKDYLQKHPEKAELYFISLDYGYKGNPNSDWK